MAEEGLIIDVDYNITKAEAKQRKLNRELEISETKARNIKNRVEELNKELEKEKMAQADIKDAYNSQLKEAAELERHIEKIKNGTATVSETMQFGGLNSAEAKLAEIEKSIKGTEKSLEKNYNNQKQITREISKQELALKRQNSTTANIGNKIVLNSKKQNKFTAAFKKSEKSADRFGRRLKSLISSALFFTVVTKAFTALRQEFGKLITESGTKTAKLTAQLKGSVAVLGRTLYESARPAIEGILTLLLKVVNVLTYGLAKILGKNVSEMKKLAQNTKKTGEEAKKTTASFDTLNTIDSSSSESESGSVEADYSGIESGISGATAALMAILGGALLVIGAVLLFTGTNIPLGLGLLAIGAISLGSAVAANWSALTPEIQNTILILAAIISTALIVIGFILIASGANLGLGIALLALGIAGTVTAAALAWGSLTPQIQNVITIIAAIVGAAALVVGAILAFTGVNLALGIALMALGAVALISAAALSWSKLSDNMKNVISIITAIVSAAVLVLGAILTFTGVNIPLGIALLVLGAVGLVSAAVANWGKLTENIKQTITIITAIVSAALLVLGVILAFTGAAIPLGIAFIVLGAAGLAAAYTLSWNSLPEKTKNTISTIMAIGGALLLVIGIILCFCGIFPLGIGLIVVGAASLVGSMALNWNAFKDKVKSIATSIGTIFKNCWNGIKKGFKAMVNGIIWLANKWIDGWNFILLPVRGLIYGIAQAFGSDLTLDEIKIPHIPKLATGAVIPGGQPFYAMLGDQPRGKTNLEAPEDLIRQIVREESGAGNMEIKATGSLAPLIRLLRLEIQKEDKRASVF